MTLLQEQYLQEATQSIDAAKVLINSGHFNYAAARAYFAMFYVASAVLASADKQFSKHTAVISAFGRDYAKTGKMPAKFHKYLLQGIELRQQADYDMIQNLTEEQAATQVSRAIEFLEYVQQAQN